MNIIYYSIALSCISLLLTIILFIVVIASSEQQPVLITTVHNKSGPKTEKTEKTIVKDSDIVRISRQIEPFEILQKHLVISQTDLTLPNPANLFTTVGETVQFVLINNSEEEIELGYDSHWSNTLLTENCLSKHTGNGFILRSTSISSAEFYRITN
jgi:hypothetical protein